MKYILLIFISLFSLQTFASDDWWIERQITIEKNQNSHAKKVYGQSARIIRENAPISSGASQTARDLVRRSIAVDVPTVSKVGTPMFKRLMSSAGGKMLGVYAVTQLIEAIGWVMEDGAYVKKIKEEDDDEDCKTKSDCEIEWAFDGKKYPSASSACKAFVVWQNRSDYVMRGIEDFKIYPSYQQASCVYGSTIDNGRAKFQLTGTPNSDYKPKEKPERTVPLTPALLGAAMLGTGYKDPDPNFNNDQVNTGDYTGVAETYEHDPSGVGNERADAMDEKLKNAKPTSDGKSSYIGDPKYDDKSLTDGDTSADRSWDNDAGQADGESKPQTDPDTGEATGGQSIAFKFPIFCEWASSMCKWYDDWKKSDQVYKDHMTKTEDHQTEEKSFWKTVKDWFDWTKEEPEEQQETEQTDIDYQGIFSKKFDAVFSLSKQCPPDLKFSLQTKYLSGTWDFSLNWLCIFFTFIAYPLQLLSHMIGLWVLYETCIRKEIKW
ncbi:hypothetical protein EXE25_18775 [Acinetobacter bouvetii]|uniref:Uncharacterized protein n=1 Tax=Acinetobacter bouvetii TaxID=202951 RepID=A0A4Q7APR7_9GAMM|nr:hypothetical protein [Acinetobacter bouvetii]RZG63706.1 hypothetical protein EXE25_18775 [Acinetobacter bouvetii]